MVVDDDVIAVEILRAALESAGYEVFTASDGAEALEVLTSRDIRLLISDWEMPRLDGLELCKRVRRQADGYVYIILLTSHGSQQEVVAGMRAGADDFMVKPFKQEELAARVEAGLRVLSLETRDMVIFSLAKLAESRDFETGMHLERVQRYSRLLAEALAVSPGLQGQIDSNFIRLVYQTSPLHDIGKVAIPDKVLLKPGRLDAEEFEVMKTHTTLGAETLNAALQQFPQARFLRFARDIALSHHERWDGAGYPQGLSETDIPLSARIVAVADVYDALTSRRVYKDVFSHQVARDIILSETSAQFDPEIVSAFLNVEDDFLDIRRRFNDHAEEGSGDGLPQPQNACSIS